MATLAVHHPTPTHPRLQSRSGTHADALLSLRDGAPRPSVLQPHLDTCQPRQRIPCNAAACTCNGAASLGASLCLCKNFNVELCPRSFLWLASPLVGVVSCTCWLAATSHVITGQQRAAARDEKNKNRSRRGRATRAGSSLAPSRLPPLPRPVPFSYASGHLAGGEEERKSEDLLFC